MRLQDDPMVNLVCMRISSHAGASGYDRLADYLDANVIGTLERKAYLRRVANRAFRFVAKRSGSMWYDGIQFVTELEAAWQWRKSSRQIFHFLYGENSYRYLWNLRANGISNHIVCTYHTPGDKFQEEVSDRSHLSHIDAAIVVSTVQLDFYSRLLGRDRVFYVPHGIDVDYFTPGPPDRSRPDDGFQCIFVGKMLRDFKTLAETARLLEKWASDVRIVVVTNERRWGYFAGMENVTLISGIPDRELLNLYRQSDLLLLPLCGATANNSLLEGMACGLPVVTTDLQGTRDYVDEGCALLTPRGDARTLAETVLQLKEDEARRVRMGRMSRIRALDFRWQNVASMVRGVYGTILGTGKPVSSDNGNTAP